MTKNHSLNWQDFKKVKGFNKVEMERFTENLFKNAFAEGFRSGAKASDKIDDQINLARFLGETDIKGIGEKRKETLLKAYRECLKEDDNESTVDTSDTETTETDN